MKSIVGVSSIALIILTSVYSFTYLIGEVPAELAIGVGIPKGDVKLKEISGAEISLSNSNAANGLLVIFSCNACPYVKLSEGRIKENAALAKSNKIGVVVLNSNEAQRGDVDSFEEMRKHGQEQKYMFSYAMDKNSEIADAFGATRTPHCFLFDKSGILVYRGAIDDNIKVSADAKEHFLKDAIIATSKGEKVKINSTKSIGCTIKRVLSGE